MEGITQGGGHIREGAFAEVVEIGAVSQLGIARFVEGAPSLRGGGKWMSGVMIAGRCDDLLDGREHATEACRRACVQIYRSRNLLPHQGIKERSRDIFSVRVDVFLFECLFVGWTEATGWLLVAQEGLFILLLRH